MTPRHLPLWMPLIYALVIVAIFWIAVILHTRKEDREFWRKHQ